MAACLLALCLTGCDRPDPPTQPYLPTAALAREALLASLQSWVDETETPRLATGQPSLQFADSLRTGRTLQSFEIIGELPGEGARRFEVHLKLSKPPGSETAQYVVLGIDPLWVIRQEDYDMITHWDHPMPNDAVPVSDDASQSAGATADE
jgi:hypothetical protein